MTKDMRAIDYREGQRMLFEHASGGMPFIMFMATLLSTYLFYTHGPRIQIAIWWLAMIFVNSIRMIYCRIILRKDLLKDSTNVHAKIFLYSTAVAGLTWSMIFFFAAPHASDQQLFVLLLVLAGISSGATTTLSVYLPALVAFVYGMFIPIIVYYYSFGDSNHVILATTFLVYSNGLLFIGLSHQRLLRNAFVLTKEIEMLSITDVLTGLYNRRHFEKTSEVEYHRARRNRQSFALVAIDVDNFKLVNDNFGHAEGDRFLKYIASYLQHHLRRANDVIFRVGGDEFAALLTNITEDGTKHICEKIKTQFLKDPAFEYDVGKKQYSVVLPQVSFSIGIVYVPFDAQSNLEQILEQVDKALYSAKREGKNQIQFTKCS